MPGFNDLQLFINAWDSITETNDNPKALKESIGFENDADVGFVLPSAA